MASKYKWVLFDMYDTIFITHYAERYLYENKVLWKCFKKNGIIIGRQTFYEKLQELKYKIPQNKPLPKKELLEQQLAKTFGYNLSLNQAEKIHKEQYRSRKAHSKLAKNTKQILERLKKKGIKLALISNAHTASLIRNLEHSEIKKYFDEIIISDSVKGLKSELIPFKHFLQKHRKIKPEDCLMVGDSVYEDTACQKLGIPSCILEYNLAQTSNNTLEKLKMKGLFPKYRINSLIDLKEIL